MTGGYLWDELLFNSHPHKEDDVAVTVTEQDSQIFNSHPHKEDDTVKC